MSNKENLLALFAPKVVPVEVTVGDDTMTVHVRELSAAQVFDMQKKHETSKDRKRFALLLVSEALVEENGEKSMTLAEAEAMLQLKVEAFNALAEAVSKAVGLKQTPKEGEGPKA